MALKLLLGLTRGTKFKQTALGAVALHANDYAESRDRSSLAEGVLPVVTEFAPVWELQNPPDIGATLRRFYFVYRKLLATDARMKQLLEGDLGCEVDEIKFAGLPFDVYFALLFGIYAAVAHSVQARSLPTSILDLHDIAGKAGLSESDLASFISQRAMTETEARLHIGALDSVETFTRNVTDSCWSSDFRVFRDRPLLTMSDGRFVALDLQFLFENASRGLYWSIFSRLSRKGQKLFPSLWGGLFETYVQRLIAHYYPGVLLNVLFDGGEVDAVLRLPNAVLLIEIKSGFLPQDAKGSRDEDIFAKAVATKFIANAKGNPKGVGQLATAIEAVRKGRFPGVGPGDCVYPILVGEDPVLQAFAMNTYLDRLFTDRVGDTSTRLTVATVDEIETLLPYLAAEDVSVVDLLNSRVTGGRMTPESVNSTFFIASLRRLRTRPETFLSKQGDELTAIIDERYASLNVES